MREHRASGKKPRCMLADAPLIIAFDLLKIVRFGITFRVSSSNALRVEFTPLLGSPQPQLGAPAAVISALHVTPSRNRVQRSICVVKGMSRALFASALATASRRNRNSKLLRSNKGFGATDRSRQHQFAYTAPVRTVFCLAKCSKICVRCCVALFGSLGESAAC